MEICTVFQNVDAYAGDPILSLMETFKQDARPHKVNLSIGLYYNEQGVIPQMQAVAAAEEQLHAQPQAASLYLPMEGLPPYRSAIAPLLFGAEHPVLKAGRIATIQTLGGSGALKVLLPGFAGVGQRSDLGKPYRHLQRCRFHRKYLPVV